MIGVLPATLKRIAEHPGGPRTLLVAADGSDTPAAATHAHGLPYRKAAVSEAYAERIERAWNMLGRFDALAIDMIAALAAAHATLAETRETLLVIDGGSQSSGLVAAIELSLTEIETTLAAAGAPLPQTIGGAK